MSADRSKGFIAVYTWRVEEPHEADFRRTWHAITLRARQNGALGSTLGRDSEGRFVAVALWPDEASRGRFFNTANDVATFTGAERISETTMNVEDDLWLSSPFALHAKRASSGEA